MSLVEGRAMLAYPMPSTALRTSRVTGLRAYRTLRKLGLFIGKTLNPSVLPMWSLCWARTAAECDLKPELSGIHTQ